MVGRGAGRKGWRMVAKKQEMAEDFKKKKKSKDAAEITRKRKNDTEQVKEQKGC